MSARLICADAVEGLRTLADESVQTCVTSPPYWGLRDYGVAGQLGLEPTPGEYVARMVEVFAEVGRVLREDGTLWLNVGDSYASSTKGSGGLSEKQLSNAGSLYSSMQRFDHGMKPKDLVGIPWRLAFALQDAGWYLRSDIIWSKPNPMPESVTDRPTKSHEYLFLLTKRERYYYDAAAIAEPVQYGDHPRNGVPKHITQAPGQTMQSGITKRRRSGNKERVLGPGRGRPDSHLGASVPWEDQTGKRNARSVWTITTRPFKEAHFATFPPELPRRCILAGSRVGDTVLDPFAGAGTTLLVADRLQRDGVGIELNPKYVEMARRRIASDAPLFAGAR